MIEVDGGEIKETVEGSAGGYTGDFDGKWGLKATQAITDRVEPVGDDQGAARSPSRPGPVAQSRAS